MPKVPHSILRALSRWEDKGLLDSEKVQALREEAESEVQGESRRWSLYLLAATGGAVLIVAGGTFLAWAWPEMGAGGQSATLALIGFLVAGLGVRLPKTSRWAPVAYLLQLAGSILILMALVHSEKAWVDESPAGWAVGVFALCVPPVLFGLAIRQNGILAGLQAALAFFFIFVFLDRALGLDEEAVVWVLDCVMILALAVLAWKLRNPDVPEWALSVFLSLLFSSVVLVVLSGEFIWDLDETVIYPMDVWLLTVVGMTLWGLQEKTPKHLRRDWYEHQLALCILVAIPFAFITTLEALNDAPTPAALTVAVVGGLGLWYSVPRGARSVLVASCMALLISAWYWGAEMNGALGAVVALVVASALLFWGASRLGRHSIEPGETRGPKGPVDLTPPPA